MVNLYQNWIYKVTEQSEKASEAYDPSSPTLDDPATTNAKAAKEDATSEHKVDDATTTCATTNAGIVKEDATFGCATTTAEVAKENATSDRATTDAEVAQEDATPELKVGDENVPESAASRIHRMAIAQVGF